MSDAKPAAAIDLSVPPAPTAPVVTPSACPGCGNTRLGSVYYNGSQEPTQICKDCGWSSTAPAAAKAVAEVPPENPMASMIGHVLHDIAEAIEEQIGDREKVAPEDSPYASSLKLAYEKRLQAAAAAALAVIVNHPMLRVAQQGT